MQTVDRSEEKLALAKELGLSIIALVQMKFKPIDGDEIRSKLRKIYFKIDSNPNDFSILALGSFLCSTFPLGFFLSFPTSRPWSLPTFLCFLAISALVLACSFIHETRVKSKPLKDWEHFIPYGALLAVKEAKQAGLDNFEIYYPITHKATRILSDPIIVGYYYPSTMQAFEIFAWDDGKVYE